VIGCKTFWLAMAAATATSLAETRSKVNVAVAGTQKNESDKDNKSVASSSRHISSKSSAKSVTSNNPHIKEGDFKDSSDTGWNTVGKKSEKYENRFGNHGHTNEHIDRYRGVPRRRPPFRGYPRKMNRTKEPMRSSGTSNKEFAASTSNNSELNGGIVDSHSSGESADSDGKKYEENEYKTKPEYIAAPMPKTNAWGKTKVQVAEKTDTNTSATSNQKQNTEEKSAAPKKTQHPPANNAWKKVNDKADVEMTKDDKADKEQPNSAPGCIFFFYV